jgi:uncharacterized protein
MSARAIAEKVVTTTASRVDSWINALTGLGTLRDKLEYFTVSRGVPLNDNELDTLYNTSDMASRICDAVPDEMLRQGFEVNVDADEDNEEGDAQEITSGMHMRCDELGVREKYNEAMAWARLFGGSAIYVGADDGQDPREPLNIDGIKSLAFLNVMDKRTLKPLTFYDDPLLPMFGEVRTFEVVPMGRDSKRIVIREHAEIHESRLIIFGGVRTTATLRNELKGWGQSVLQRCKEPLKQFDADWAAVSHLVQDAHQAVFKVKGLIDMIASGEKEALMTRMQLVDMSRSVARAMMIDADDEEFGRESIALNGLEGILDKAMLRLAAAARMPATILMAQSPAGLNATGESDIRWFYDTVRSAQMNELRPRLERLVRLIFLSKDGPTGGREPTSWSIGFPPLWQMSPRETAELRKMIAETDVAYIDRGVTLPEEITLSRFRPEGYSTEYQVALDIRKAALDVLAGNDNARLADEADDAAPAPGGRSAGAGTGKDAPTDPNAVDPQSALNGAQVAALQEIILAVASRQLPRATGVKMVAAAFPLSVEQAEGIMGPVGVTFFAQAASTPANVNGRESSEQTGGDANAQSETTQTNRGDDEPGRGRSTGTRNGSGATDDRDDQE